MVFKQIQEVLNHPKIKVMTSATLEKLDGQPGLFDADIKTAGDVETLRVGTVVMAAGWKPYDATKLTKLGDGLSKDVITNIEEGDGQSGQDRAALRRQSPRSGGLHSVRRFPGPGPSPLLLRLLLHGIPEAGPVCPGAEPQRHRLYPLQGYPHPGQMELFYKQVQSDPGVMLTKAEIAEVGLGEGGAVQSTPPIPCWAPTSSSRPTWWSLATGMVPATADDPVLNLGYRQGPGLPDLELFSGFADSNFICFPDETRRTGIYAAGCVHQPMNMAMAVGEDGVDAACKAIQAAEHVAEGMALHPRAWDITFPDPFMQRCTSCKRCTEECPFGAIEEDEKGTPFFKINRCRRCATCMGACPERIISFKDYSVDQIGSMLKSLDVPEIEDEDDPLAPLRVIGLVCENDALPALDAAGLHKLRLNPMVRFISLRCLGSFNMVWVSDALSRGIDGMILLGCKHGDDYQRHFAKGSELCEYRLSKLSETLDKLGLESDRVIQYQIGHSDFDRLPQIIDESCGPGARDRSRPLQGILGGMIHAGEIIIKL